MVEIEDVLNSLSSYKRNAVLKVLRAAANSGRPSLTLVEIWNRLSPTMQNKLTCYKCGAAGRFVHCHDVSSPSRLCMRPRGASSRHPGGVAGRHSQPAACFRRALVRRPSHPSLGGHLLLPRGQARPREHARRFLPTGARVSTRSRRVLRAARPIAPPALSPSSDSLLTPFQPATGETIFTVGAAYTAFAHRWGRERGVAPEEALRRAAATPEWQAYRRSRRFGYSDTALKQSNPKYSAFLAAYDLKMSLESLWITLRELMLEPGPGGITRTVVDLVADGDRGVAEAGGASAPRRIVWTANPKPSKGLLGPLRAWKKLAKQIHQRFEQSKERVLVPVLEMQREVAELAKHANGEAQKLRDAAAAQVHRIEGLRTAAAADLDAARCAVQQSVDGVKAQVSGAAQDARAQAGDVADGLKAQAAAAQNVVVKQAEGMVAQAGATAETSLDQALATMGELAPAGASPPPTGALGALTVGYLDVGLSDAPPRGRLATKFGKDESRTDAGEASDESSDLDLDAMLNAGTPATAASATAAAAQSRAAAVLDATQDKATAALSAGQVRAATASAEATAALGAAQDGAADALAAAQGEAVATLNAAGVTASAMQDRAEAAVNAAHELAASGMGMVQDELEAKIAAIKTDAELKVRQVHELKAAVTARFRDAKKQLTALFRKMFLAVAASGAMKNIAKEVREFLELVDEALQKIVASIGEDVKRARSGELPMQRRRASASTSRFDAKDYTGLLSGLKGLNAGAVGAKLRDLGGNLELGDLAAAAGISDMPDAAVLEEMSLEKMFEAGIGFLLRFCMRPQYPHDLDLDPEALYSSVQDVANVRQELGFYKSTGLAGGVVTFKAAKDQLGSVKKRMQKALGTARGGGA